MAAIDTGDTAFILISAALVMFMVPGLALFYGGMVRHKNVLGTLMQSFFSLAVVSILWAVLGYTLAFGPDIGGLIGGLKWFGLAGIGQEPGDYAETIPAILFMMYQGLFAGITPALITGAFAERMKFSAFIIFTAVWSLVVYAPIAHWVWGGGWIGGMGALDFAGGTVVHISSGAAALAAVLIIGKRQGFKVEIMHPHNVPMTVLGAGILWFGWFGFNAGSALSSGGLAALAFVNTNLAASAALLGWVVAEWLNSGKPTVLGGVSGAVAGLVAVTPAAGFIGPLSAVALGFVAGIVCYFAVNLKWKLGYDDSLDVVGIHLVGGTLGALATGLLASTVVNSGGDNGLFYGNAGLFTIQFVSVMATIVYSFILTVVILKVLDLIMGVRVSEEDEKTGIDLSQHSEVGYALHD